VNLTAARAGFNGTSAGSASDFVNRRTWERPNSLKFYRRLEGFTEPGERHAFGRVRADARRGRVLDIGVGGGRTAAIVLAETGDYVGIDYTPAMIEICRGKYPQARFEVADARDLSRFAAGEFTLVQFSYNGIDAVGEEDRKRVLAEACRVLAPGGAFFFSTFNRLGPAFARGRLTLRTIDLTQGPRNVLWSLAKYVVGAAVGLWHRLTMQRFEQAANVGKLRLHPAHDYGILVHTTTLPEMQEELAEAGFARATEIFGSSGRALRGDEEAREEEYFHLIARKPQVGNASDHADLSVKSG
jgi:SAM-dependent methyltransferase